MPIAKVGVPRGGSASLAPSLDPSIKTDNLYMLSIFQCKAAVMEDQVKRTNWCCYLDQNHVHYKTGSLIVYHGSDVRMSECEVNSRLEKECTKCVATRSGANCDKVVIVARPPQLEVSFGN